MSNVHLLPFFVLLLFFVSHDDATVDKSGGSVTAYQIVELFSASMHIFIILLIAVLGGEAVWRDIERRIGSITGCLPIPRHLLFAARTAAVFVLVLCMATIVFIASALYLLRSNEAISGQLLFSLIYLYGYVAVGYLYYCVLSVGVQALADNKYRGYVLFAFVNFLPFQFSSSVISRNIWVPGYTPRITYADLAGFPEDFILFYMFTAYWLLFGLFVWHMAIESFPATEGQRYKDRYRRLVYSVGLRFPKTFHMMVALFILLGILIFNLTGK